MCRVCALGSILRDDLDPQGSDIDVLVEFEPQAVGNFTNFLDLKKSKVGREHFLAILFCQSA